VGGVGDTSSAPGRCTHTCHWTTRSMVPIRFLSCCVPRKHCGRGLVGYRHWT